VKVLSYDDEKVAFVHGDAEAGDSGPKMQGKELGTDISVKVGPAGQVFTERVFRAVAPAKALALAELKRRALEFVHAEATVQGAADLRPGFVVEIAGVGEVFSGPYYITRVVHDYLPSGFTTRLGLKKTSIILEPPNQKDDSNTTQSRQTQDDDGEDSLDLGDGGAPAKPVLKNLQFAVGDKPPDWFLDDSGLDTGPQVTNLLLTYGPCPPEAHIIDPDVEGLPHETNLKFGYQVDPNAPPAPVFAGPMDAPLVAPPDPKPDIANVKLGYQEGQTYLGANLDDALKAQLAAADAPPKPDLADVKLGYQDGTGPQDLQNVDDLLKQQLAAASDATKPDLADVKLGYQDGVGVGVGSNGADNAWKPTDVDALAAPPQAPDLANVKLNYSEG
jgi:hypothetical protein